MSKLYLVVAPSGAGKSTIINEIFDKDQQIVSFTTRPIRSGEVDGEDYYFVSSDEFDYLEDLDGELIQKAEYSGNRYGVTKSEIEQKLALGDCVIAVVMDGFLRYKELYPNDTIGIFLDVSREVVENRLNKRNDGKKIVEQRLSQYDIDIKNKEYFEKDTQSFIINVDGNLKENVELFRDIIENVGMKDDNL